MKHDSNDNIRQICLNMDFSWNITDSHRKLVNMALAGGQRLSGRAIKLLRQTPPGMEVLNLLLQHGNIRKKVAVLQALPQGNEEMIFSLLKENSPAIRAAAVNTLNRWRLG